MYKANNESKVADDNRACLQTTKDCVQVVLNKMRRRRRICHFQELIVTVLKDLFETFRAQVRNT
jgi:hypothetical protein